MKQRPGIRTRLGLELFSRLHADAVRRHQLRTLFWECTLRCNLACLHCGSDCRAEAGAADMPLADFLDTVDRCVTPHVDPHGVMVIFSGGEPLLRPDLEQAGLALYRRGYPWGLVTNGMALDRARFEALLRAGLHSVSVSLDGLAADHNRMRGNGQSFDRALRALRMIAREPTVAYDAVSCITSLTFPSIEGLRDLLIREGIRHWRIFTVFEAGRAVGNESLALDDEAFRALMEFIRRTRREGRIDVSYACEGFLGGYETRVRDHFYYCSAGVHTASIRVDGAISGCTSIRADYDQGNIYTDDFWQVWSERFVPFRRREWARTGECADCSMFRYCLGGGMHLRDGEGKLTMCHYKRLGR